MQVSRIANINLSNNYLKGSDSAVTMASNTFAGERDKFAMQNNAHDQLLHKIRLWQNYCVNYDNTAQQTFNYLA